MLRIQGLSGWGFDDPNRSIILPWPAARLGARLHDEGGVVGSITEARNAGYSTVQVWPERSSALMSPSPWAFTALAFWASTAST